MQFGDTKSTYHDVTSSGKSKGSGKIKENDEFYHLLLFLELIPTVRIANASCNKHISRNQLSQQLKDPFCDTCEEEDTEMKTVEDFEPNLSVRRKGITRNRSKIDRLLQDPDEEQNSKQLVNNPNACDIQNISVVNGLNWFSLGSSSDVWKDWNNLELNSWLEEYVNYVNRLVVCIGLNLVK